MEQDKVLDKKNWSKISKRINSEMNYEDFQVMCTYHAKYKKHKYTEPSFCSCNAKQIKQWIREVDECLK